MSAIASALIAGGVAAGVQGLGQGIAALTPAARAQRQMRKQMTADAQSMMTRGKRHGWGYTPQKKRELVASEMRAAEAAAAPLRDDALRQAAVQGTGRGGAMDSARAQMSRERAQMGAETAARVRAESQQVGQQRQAMARNLFAQAQGMNVEAQQRAASVLSDVAASGINTGIKTYGMERDKEEYAALRAALGQTQNKDASLGNLPPEAQADLLRFFRTR